MLAKFIKDNQIPKPVTHQTTMTQMQKLLVPEEAKEIAPFQKIQQSVFLDDDYSPARQIFLSLCKSQKYESIVTKMQKLNEFVIDEVLQDYSEQINYTTYIQIREKLVSKDEIYGQLLSATFFALLPQIENTLQLINKKQLKSVQDKYIYKQDLSDALHHQIHAMQFRVQLDSYTVTDTITEDALQNYITELYPSFNNGITPDTEPFYICYVTKAISFFLDPKGTKKMNLNALVSSFYLQSALSLHPHENARIFGPLSAQNSSIFTLAAFQQAYAMFQQASARSPESCGLLSKNNTGYLQFYPSRKFVESWYFSLELYNGCIDFRQYVDYLLALSYPCSTAAGFYVFNILDAQWHKGYITREDVKEYFDSIFDDMLKIYSEVGIPKDDFIDEIFDNIKPKDGKNIYFSDIQRTKSSEYLVRYLVSIASLMEKENFAQTASPVLNDVPWGK
ncbi:Conserved_hypothetical protein [Hexamita inflata]|uniref:Uncharacterized protein n=1 Tax=Hexamita inflata TaxID=28002 RepID=A0AA86PEJ8_9EUKA|nr:Conserved hypothetical protein [Hexamita inflata]